MSSYGYLLSGFLSLLAATVSVGLLWGTHPNALSFQWVRKYSWAIHQTSLLCGFVGMALIVMSASHRLIGHGGLEPMVLGTSLICACLVITKLDKSPKNPDSWGSPGCFAFLVATVLVVYGFLQALPIQ